MQGTITPAQWEETLRCWDHRCAYCRKRGKMTIDHIVPVSRGGANDIENVVSACKACNDRKNNVPLGVFLERQGVPWAEFVRRYRQADEFAQAA